MPAAWVGALPPPLRGKSRVTAESLSEECFMDADCVDARAGSESPFMASGVRRKGEASPASGFVPSGPHHAGSPVGRDSCVFV